MHYTLHAKIKNSLVNVLLNQHYPSLERIPLLAREDPYYQHHLQDTYHLYHRNHLHQQLAGHNNLQEILEHSKNSKSAHVSKKPSNEEDSD